MKFDFKNSKTSLASVEPGEWALVTDLDTSCPVGRRLLDLGFAPGTRILVIRRAPLGDPVEFALRGVRICLRGSEAARIGVHVLEARAEALP